MKSIQSNSVTAAITAAQAAAAAPLEWPKQIRRREQDEQFWDAIIVSRARDEWAPNDLIVAGQLARCQADIEREAAELDNEGSVVENNRGTPVMNPRHSVLEQLSRRQMALMRALRMGGSAVVDKRDLNNKRKLERNARQIAEELDEEELLA